MVKALLTLQAVLDTARNSVPSGVLQSRVVHSADNWMVTELFPFVK